MYVADFGNARIDKFDTDGNFVKAWGKDVGGSGVPQCTTTCVAGGLSSGPGDQFEGPNGVGVDEAGNVLVVDETSARVQKFDADGNFVFALGEGVATGAGSAEKCTTVASCHNGTGGAQGGEFSSPTAVTGDSTGIYVVDEDNQRLDKFAPDGTFTYGVGMGVNIPGSPADRCVVASSCQAGGSDAQGGHFNNPEGVASDHNGSVYVGDENANRIQKFDSVGGVPGGVGPQRKRRHGVRGVHGRRQLPPRPVGTLGGEMSNVMGIASDANGSVYVADVGNFRVQRFLDGALAKPTLDGVAPAHRANDNAPKITGTAPATSTVQLFTDPSCAGAPVTTGSAATFASPGIAVSVADDSVTSFYANDTKNGFTSRCAASITYTEDSTGPDTCHRLRPVRHDHHGHAHNHVPRERGRRDLPVPFRRRGVRGLPRTGRHGHAGAAAGRRRAHVRGARPRRPRQPGRDARVGIVHRAEARYRAPAATAAAEAGRGQEGERGPGQGRRAREVWNGKVRPGFVPLETLGRHLPVGSTLDTRKGTVTLTLATNTKGTKTQIGNFSEGSSRSRQGKKNPLTTLSMTGGGLNKCKVKLPHGGSPKLASEARKRRRTLFSSVKGHFRTRGRNSIATVRGTKYRVTDDCKGTKTTVTEGTVSVLDLTQNLTKIVKGGHSYFASAPKKHPHHKP